MDLEFLRQQIIGNGSFITTPYGKRLLTYADYTASGRSLKFLEDYLLSIKETYANTHTEDTYTGSQMTTLYHQAKDMIRSLLGATNDYIIIGIGSGATGAIHKLTQILGVYEAPATRNSYDQMLNQLAEASCECHQAISGIRRTNLNQRPVVFITPYEHHSNVLPWREGNCDVVEINLTPDGKVDLMDLEVKLADQKYENRLKIGAFSAASNVTGMISPVEEMTQLVHLYGGYVFFDYAACAPYIDIQIFKDHEQYIDGIYLSPHKFLGGPGCSGLLVFHKKIYNQSLAPTCSGGGTVEYVNSIKHDFKHDIEQREDAGTPGILQMIQTACVLKIKEQFGVKRIEEIENHYINHAHELLMNHAQIELMGKENDSKYLSILSFNILYLDGYLHPRFVIKLLNDLFGIQGRAGCSCAGPYGHRLLGIDEQQSEGYRKVILEGFESMKPGWVRLNFHYSIDEETFQYIIEAILLIASHGYLFLEDYDVEHHTGLWQHVNQEAVKLRSLDFLDFMGEQKKSDEFQLETAKIQYRNCLQMAHDIIEEKRTRSVALYKVGSVQWPELAWFFAAEI